MLMVVQQNPSVMGKSFQLNDNTSVPQNIGFGQIKENWQACSL